MRFAHMDDAAQPLVLVVEDNELLRLHAADLLEAPGFAVIKAEGSVRLTQVILRMAQHGRTQAVIRRRGRATRPTRRLAVVCRPGERRDGAPD